MAVLPTNRTEGDPNHVSDHNELNDGHNLSETHRNAAAPHTGHETPAGAQAKVDTHAADTTSVHGIADTADLMTVTTADVRYINESDHTLATHQSLGLATDADLDAHIADGDGAHVAGAISFVPTGNIASTNVQAAIAEVALEAGSGGTIAASSVTVTPTGGLAADDVQEALAELDAEKQALSDLDEPGNAASTDLLQRGLNPLRLLDPTPPLNDPTLLWSAAPPSTLTMGAANGGRLQRWVAPRTTKIVGVQMRCATASGNIEVAIYDEHMTKLGGSGSIACPAAGSAINVQFATGVAITAGKTYLLFISADNNVAAFGAMLSYLMAGRPIAGTLTSGAFPAPAVIYPRATGFSWASTQAIVMAPLLMPPTTAELAATTLPTVGEVVGFDDTSGRLFGRSGGGSGLFVSDNNGDSWTNPVSWAGEIIGAVVAEGAYLFVATRVPATSTGRIRRCARAGPYAAGDFTLVLDNQEGYCLPWNLVVGADGIIFAANYWAPSAGQVRIRKSTNWGATWTVVLDLGPGIDGESNHVHGIIRDGTNVYANIGDGGTETGLYESSDTGDSFTRTAAYGDLRLIPPVKVDAGILWGSDHWYVGGNLFLHDPIADTLKPRSIMDAPWWNDVYAIHKDDEGLVWYLTFGSSQTSSKRAGLFVSPDDGLTSYLVVDLGWSFTSSWGLFRKDDYVFYTNKRVDVSALDLAGFFG
jgi:hypothetical protein